MNIDLSKCPRCFGEWIKINNDDYLYASKCGMRYYPTNIYPCVELDFDKNSYLKWWLNFNICKYNQTIVPWMPFDITLERLKKLLVYL